MLGNVQSTHVHNIMTKVLLRMWESGEVGHGYIHQTRVDKYQYLSEKLNMRLCVTEHFRTIVQETS